MYLLQVSHKLLSLSFYPCFNLIISIVIYVFFLFTNFLNGICNYWIMFDGNADAGGELGQHLHCLINFQVKTALLANTSSVVSFSYSV